MIKIKAFLLFGQSQSSGIVKGDTNLSTTVYKLLQDTNAILQRTPTKESFKKLTRM